MNQVCVWVIQQKKKCMCVSEKTIYVLHFMVTQTTQVLFSLPLTCTYHYVIDDWATWSCQQPLKFSVTLITAEFLIRCTNHKEGFYQIHGYGVQWFWMNQWSLNLKPTMSSMDAIENS